MSSFKQYNNVLLDGFVNNAKSREVVDKKYDLLTKILAHDQLNSQNILFVGFSPWCLSLELDHFTITEVDHNVVDFLSSKSANCIPADLSDLISQGKKFDVVVAVEEYFTFANTDEEQRNLVNDLAQLTNQLLITTLRDYKNQDFKDREFSQPIMIRGQNENKIYLDHYDYDLIDKNASLSRTFVINDAGSTMYGPFERRNMYFKQLAKFSIDAGAKNFYVHKNLMYKSVIKKNYEHVITIKF